MIQILSIDKIAIGTSANANKPLAPRHKNSSYPILIAPTGQSSAACKASSMA